PRARAAGNNLPLWLFYVPVILFDSRVIIKPRMRKKGLRRMSIDTVLFDLDGTLIDSLPLIRRTFERVFTEMGIPVNDEVMSWTGRPLKEIGQHFVGRREPEFFELYQRYYAIDHDQ